MPVPISAAIQEFEFSDEEMEQVFAFTELQKLHLTSMKAICLQQLAEMEYDPSKPHELVHRQAWLNGQVTVLDTLLVGAEMNAKTANRQLSQEQ